MRHALDDVHRVGVRGRVRSLEAAALVDRDVDHDRTGLHACDHLARHELRGERAGDQHGPDHEIRLLHRRGDLEARRHQQRDATRENLLEVAHAVDRPLEDRDLRSETQRDHGGVVAHDPAADHDDAARRDARHAAEQQAATAGGTSS